MNTPVFSYLSLPFFFLLLAPSDRHEKFSNACSLVRKLVANGWHFCIFRQPDCPSVCLLWPRIVGAGQRVNFGDSFMHELASDPSVTPQWLVCLYHDRLESVMQRRLMPPVRWSLQALHTISRHPQRGWSIACPARGRGFVVVYFLVVTRAIMNKLP